MDLMDLMDLMHENDVGVVLSTPTSSPPPWMGRLHRDTLPVTEDLQPPPTDWSSCPRCRPLSRRAGSRAYARGSAPGRTDLGSRRGDGGPEADSHRPYRSQDFLR